uniref:Uncharacterized protein n=1 Tax=Anguilla anguilla TaxID=7936 RepID=A0A0E9PRS6_ANGAN
MLRRACLVLISVCTDKTDTQQCELNCP